MAPIVDFRKVAGKKGFYRKSVEILPLFQSDRRRLLPAGQDVETTGGREHRKGVVHDASDSLKQSRFVGQVPNLPYKSWEESGKNLLKYYPNPYFNLFPVPPPPRGFVSV